MKAFIIKHKKILLCLLIVLLLGTTVYTVCCFNSWGVKMSQMPAPYLWIYLRTNGFPNISYKTANNMRFSIEVLEDDLYYDCGLSLPDVAEGWAELAVKADGKPLFLCGPEAPEDEVRAALAQSRGDAGKVQPIEALKERIQIHLTQVVFGNGTVFPA